MSRFIPACSFAAACIFAVSVSAQDTTVKSKTKIEADDAKIITMTGCLSKAPSGDLFVLAGATKLTGDEMTARSKTEVEHDEDKPVGTSGSIATYELMPKEGVDLTPHVGHKVEISAIALDPKDDDDEAEVDIQTRTKIKRDDAPDSKVKTETEAELPRGENPRLTVVSVKHIAPSCTQ
jgi:hypothetical protein